ncbi:cytochrome P460 family protein [Geobacter sp. DSM 9736]|uniref:cytochrome P460 family protein n=1 Tax=Geobacter sp. DSM 9736 TaxID=1277350 RepID=UPI000B50D28E|nr:cytochrome P460 family protein [Geobacter sp. DSM 9736]SNB44779.1 Cytochrome P460 [Geobacter sp. DSM 9736]
MKKLWVVVLTMVVSFAAVAVAAEKASLPKGYQKWEKSKQKIVTDKNSLFYGIHYIYVDSKAMKTYKSGGTYPEGSRFVVDFYSIKDEGGKQVPGKKNMIVLMKKDKKATETGGWIYASFNPDGKPSGIDPVKNCFECHLKEAKNTDYIISKYADFK